jgi:hypothetical protein
MVGDQRPRQVEAHLTRSGNDYEHRLPFRVLDDGVPKQARLDLGGIDGTEA